ncbi:hypothetical protein PEC302107_35470 [Pectobacterium araliae]|nr:hypothetical protein PEC302107_35470 [Pectobacterium carotovorum subsp. carotovorum]
MGRGYHARIPQQELDLILCHTALVAPQWCGTLPPWLVFIERYSTSAPLSEGQ